MAPVQNDSEQHDKIQLAAYHFWLQRGCPIGSPEIDWLRAEQQGLQQHDQPTPNSEKSAIVAVAESVGSVLGSVAGLVASIGDLVHNEGHTDPAE